LGIDQAILSKIENGKRKAKKSQVIKLARFFKVPQKEYLIDWLSDKIVFEIEEEKYGQEALKVAEEKIKYRKHQ